MALASTCFPRKSTLGCLFTLDFEVPFLDQGLFEWMEVKQDIDSILVHYNEWQ